MKSYIEERIGQYPAHFTMAEHVRISRLIEIQDLIKRAVKAAHIPAKSVSKQVREIRMDLASRAFDRDVHSYNELSSAELWALWAYTKEHPEDVQAWIKDEYGEQLELL